MPADMLFFSGGHDGEGIPVPIPNTEVKLPGADDSWAFVPVKVGRRRFFFPFPSGTAPEARREESYSLFDIKDGAESRREDREMSLCKAVNSLKAKHGKNILLKASSYLDKARARERNGQIGGHRSQ